MNLITKYFLNVAEEYEALARQNPGLSKQDLLNLASKYRDISRIHQEASRIHQEASVIEQHNEIARKLIIKRARDLKKILDESLN